MKKSRMALTGLAVAAGLLIPAGVAQAATSAPAPALYQQAPAVPATSIQATGVVTSPTTSCRSLWSAVAASNPSEPGPANNFAVGIWTSNGCDYQGRIHIKCEFSDGSTHDYDGGWVRSNDFNDAASCPSGSYLIGAAWQSRGGPGQSVDTDWFFGP